MPKGARPDFSIRAKIGERWETVGAAWNVSNGGISVRLNLVPVGAGWDGSLLMLPPKDEDER